MFDSAFTAEDAARLAVLDELHDKMYKSGGKFDPAAAKAYRDAQASPAEHHNLKYARKDKQNRERFAGTAIEKLLRDEAERDKGYNAKCLADVKAVVAQIFDTFPSIVHIQWRQGDHYNDETTEFSYLGSTINGVECEDYSRGDEDDVDPTYPPLSKEDRVQAEEIIELIPLSVLDAAFGGAIVTATRDSITTTRYHGD